MNCYLGTVSCNVFYDNIVTSDELALLFFRDMMSKRLLLFKGKSQCDPIITKMC